MKCKLLFFKCLMEVCLNSQTRHGTDVHLRVKDLVAGLAVCFSAMHRNFGVTYHIIGAFITGRTECNADTHRGINFVTFYTKRLFHCVLQTIGNACGIAGTVQIFEQNRKFVPSQSGKRSALSIPNHEVLRPQALFETIGNHYQQTIPCRVAETVVDRFKPIQI